MTSSHLKSPADSGAFFRFIRIMTETPRPSPIPRLSWPLVFQLAGIFCVLFLLHELWSFVLLFFISVLLAVSLDPLLHRLENHLPRWISILFVVVGIGLLFLILIALVVPPVMEQANRVVTSFPHFLKGLSGHLPESGPLRQALEKMIQSTTSNTENWIEKIFTAGQFALGGLASVFFVYVFTVYLLIDGPRAFAWTTAFFKKENRDKIHQSASEIGPVISAYVSGQAVTSFLCAVFVYLLLTALKVPAAVMLAVVAGIFDILPIVGFFLSIVPALIFSLTVSPTTALVVLFLYGIYHLIENYFIVPLVYGNRLRLSGIVVLISLLVGASIGGVAGAIGILPLVASYPIIERIWLKKTLGARVVQEHEQIEESKSERGEI